MDTSEPMTGDSGPAMARTVPWKQLLGYALAGASLVWVFHDTHVERMFGHIGSMSWWWVLPAVACDVFGYVCDGARWRYLLLPVGRLSVWRATQAIYIGLFTNEVTPMRFGEVVRTYLASRWMGRPIAEVVPSMLVIRLLDGAWMAIGIGLVAIFVPLPRNLVLAGDIFGAAVLLLVGGFLILVLGEPQLVTHWARQPSAKAGLAAWVKRAVGGVLQGLQQIGARGTLAVAGAFSLGFLAFQVLAFWLIMEAYHLQLPLSVGAVVYLIVHFGTALPNAPANVGSYQFFTVLGLSLFGIEKTQATGFSVVVFIILTLPLWALGLAALSRTGMTLATIRADIRSSMRSGERASPIPGGGE